MKIYPIAPRYSYMGRHKGQDEIQRKLKRLDELVMETRKSNPGLFEIRDACGRTYEEKMLLENTPKALKAREARMSDMHEEFQAYKVKI